MLRAILRWVLALIVLAVIGAIIGIIFIFSGWYNVAASYPDGPTAKWVLNTTSDRSIRRHSSGIKLPSNLDDQAQIAKGARGYAEDCVGCHGGPEIPIFEGARAMNPEPPELVKTAGDWKPNELFWITKHGIRMTGMPAWGKEISDDEIWSDVAFMQKLPSMTPAEYSKLSASTRSGAKAAEPEDGGQAER